MAFDGANRLFIANWGAGRIDLWSPDRALEPYINGLPTPSGLAFDRQGRLYVATYSGGEILRFDQDKKREVFISGLSVVAGLYFDWHGNLLIAERGKSRVLKVSPEGEVSVLTDQGLTTPVAAIQVGKSSYVIADISGTVLLFDAELNWSRQLSTELSGPAIGLVFDPVSRDAVYAVDYGGRGGVPDHPGRQDQRCRKDPAQSRCHGHGFVWRVVCRNLVG